MKKKICFVLVVLFLTLFTPRVYAGSLNVSASTTSVVQGGSVTITVRANGLAGKFSITSSNGNVLSGGTSSVWIENESKSYKFTAKSTGKVTITVNALDVSTSEGGKFTGNKTVTINVVKPREKSTNNYLSSLSVEGFSLTPDFSKDQLEYSLEVPAETENVQINATKADGYASLDGTGEKAVSEGDNRFEIKVTSETGNERVYVVNVIVKDNNPITVDIGGKKYTVVKKASTLEKPELFEEKRISIQNIEVPGFYNESSNMTLVGLRGEDSSVSLYIYDEKEDTYTKYQPLTSKAVSIISLPNVDGLKDYSKVTVKINNEQYEGYQVNPKSNYIYLYGLRIDNGQKSWYVYDKNENTLQLYQEEEAKKIEEEYEKKLEENKTIILCLGGISIFLLLIILLLVFTRRSSSKKVKKIAPKKNKKNVANNLEFEEVKQENDDNSDGEVSHKVKDVPVESKDEEISDNLEDTLSEIEDFLNEEVGLENNQDSLYNEKTSSKKKKPIKGKGKEKNKKSK